ncbi:hypothetical protein P3T37_007386 [Kitasatospora sp. MAA4]|uniref:hypothetical protein n=1 Tax=Kitasatospora sp. MAA4 TaxID=3035093 RepID=UPI0024765009|nr:hypothetical protein [Kitasatospora sp. MAA4]MDH6137948.1 hypothetical protein [Kitasatospora sp. MAA4]
MAAKKLFDNAVLVLGPADGRAAALCRFAGDPDAPTARAPWRSSTPPWTSRSSCPGWTTSAS